MAEIRKVTIFLDAVKQQEIIQATGAKEFFEALGYLSTWNMTFDEVHIQSDGDLDLLAMFWKEGAQQPGYVIGAVWHDDHYGFHS